MPAPEHVSGLDGSHVAVLLRMQLMCLLRSAAQASGVMQSGSNV